MVDRASHETSVTSPNDALFARRVRRDTIARGTHRQCVVVLALALAFVPATVRGQYDSVNVGARIRVSIRGAAQRSLDGILVSRTADSLVVATDAPTPLRIAIANIDELAVNRGKSATRGATKGFLWGAAIGFPLPYLVCDGASCRISAFQRFGMALKTGALDGAIGALIGWKVGSDEWASYHAPSGVAISPELGGAHGAPRVGVRLTF